MKRVANIIIICTALLFLVAAGKAQEKTKETVKTTNEAYPGLASGILTFAQLGNMPEGILVRADTVNVLAADIEKIIGEASKDVQEQLKKNAFFLLENLATEKLLLLEAQKDAAQAKTDLAGKTNQEIIQVYFEKIVKPIKVTDEGVKKYFNENQEMFVGMKLEQIMEQLKEYVLGQKRQEAVTEHIRTFGKKMPIAVSASWVKEQSILAKDNPVDKARTSGKPSLVDFGSTGCVPCDMMTPILADLKKKYEGKLNVLFVHVGEEQILAAPYGTQTIPLQIFFDKDGKEVFRHVGFFAQTEIEKKLAEMGLK